MIRLVRRLLPLLAAALLAFGPAAALSDADTVTVLRTVPKDLSRETPYLTQSQMGCAAADALRDYAGTDIALLPTADLGGTLPQGLVTGADVKAVFAADREIAAAQISPRLLFQMLETAVSSIRVDPETEQVEEGSEIFGGFCQISGFSFLYDASAPVGERILRVLLPDGTALSADDGESLLTVAAPAYLLEGAFGFPALDSRSVGGCLSDALGQYLSVRSELSEFDTDRIQIIGAQTHTLAGLFSGKALAIGLAVFIAILIFYRLRFIRIRDEYGTY